MCVAVACMSQEIYMATTTGHKLYRATGSVLCHKDGDNTGISDYG